MSEQKLYIPTGNPELSGCWGPTEWEFYLTTEMPPKALVTAAGCVAVRGRHGDETMLTLNMSDNPHRKGKFEVPFGHRDQLNPEGLLESSWTTARRELGEEVGARPQKLYPFGLRKVYNPSEEKRDERYKGSPNITYMQYFVTAACEPVFMPTDPKHKICGTFLLEVVQNMVAAGKIDKTECKIVEFGMAHHKYVTGAAA